ncbi:MAG: ABC transporter substrate-binding protein [Spirochaetaceae bacterium]|jgi:iron complex transport system substrate-binding protein|nr:ABC transporter substrate-binding protein [Spirochaetaceae bacterium]
MGKKRSVAGLGITLLAMAGFCAGACRGKAPVENGTGGEQSPAGVQASAEAGPLYWQVLTEKDGEYIADREGNTIPLARYRRIVLFSPGAIETLFLIGAEDSIAAIPSVRGSIWPEEKTRLLPVVGSTSRPNVETVISFEPDLIIGNTMTLELIADLNRRGYRAIIHGSYFIEDIFNSTLLMGRLTGREAEAEALITEQRGRLAAIRSELKKQPLDLKGAFIYAADPIMAFTDKTLAGEILTILGTRNIAQGLSAAQPILSPEYILDQNPDFLFGALSFTKIEDVLSADPVILQTRAGKEKNINIIPSSLFLRPSPRIVENLWELYGEVKKFAAKSSPSGDESKP